MIAPNLQFRRVVSAPPVTQADGSARVRVKIDCVPQADWPSSSIEAYVELDTKGSKIGFPMHLCAVAGPPSLARAARLSVTGPEIVIDLPNTPKNPLLSTYKGCVSLIASRVAANGSDARQIGELALEAAYDSIRNWPGGDDRFAETRYFLKLISSRVGVNQGRNQVALLVAHLRKKRVVFKSYNFGENWSNLAIDLVGFGEGKAVHPMVIFQWDGKTGLEFKSDTSHLPPFGDLPSGAIADDSGIGWVYRIIIDPNDPLIAYSALEALSNANVNLLADLTEFLYHNFGTIHEGPNFVDNVNIVQWFDQIVMIQTQLVSFRSSSAEETKELEI